MTHTLPRSTPPADPETMTNDLDALAATLASIDARLARIEAALTNGSAPRVDRSRARAALAALDAEPRPEATPAREYLSTAQAADRLRVSPSVIRRMIRNGDLPAVPIGYGEGRRPVAWRIPADALASLPPVVEP